jgi:hypothetical protein
MRALARLAARLRALRRTMWLHATLRRSAVGTRPADVVAMRSVREMVAGVVDDARSLVDTQVTSIKTDIDGRLGDLGSELKSWLLAACVAVVAATLFALAISTTLTDVAGLPTWASLWIVSAVAIIAVVVLVHRARLSGKPAAGKPAAVEPAAEPTHVPVS